MPISLVKAHRILASLLLIFIITHLLIHSTALVGADLHIKILSLARYFYLNAIIEPILILSIIAQVIIGFMLLKRRWKQKDRGFWGWVQILSGTYLGYFLVMHSSAALITRYYVGLDTNYYWVAGTLNIGILPYFFTPYYFLAVFSLFSHLAAAIHFGWPEKAKVIAPMAMAFGAMIGVLIIMAFNGSLYDIETPPQYRQYFQDFYSQ